MWLVVHISHACSKQMCFGNVFVIKEALARACLSCKAAIARTSKFGPRWGEGIMCLLAYDRIVCYECRWLIEWVTFYIIPKANYIVQSFIMVTSFLLYVWWSTWFSFVPLTYSYMCIVCKSIAQSLARLWMAKGTLPCASYFGKRNQTSPMSTKFWMGSLNHFFLLSNSCWVGISTYHIVDLYYCQHGNQHVAHLFILECHMSEFVELYDSMFMIRTYIIKTWHHWRRHKY